MAVVVVMGVPLTARAEGVVAKVGNDEYTTLDEAVELAEEGSTIELLQDCELTKGFNKTLTFTGNGKITINKQLRSNGEGWMCFGLYDPTRVLTFDGSGVEVEWNSEVGTSSWLMLSLSGTLNVKNGAKVVFTVDSGSTGSRNAIYMNAGSEINVSGRSTFEIHGNETAGKPGQGIQLDKTGQASINVTDGSTFLIDGTNRGYVNSPSIYIEDSYFTVQNCTSNASNGGNFKAVNSTVSFVKNAGHGLSAGDLIVCNSTLTAEDNGLYGVYVRGRFEVNEKSSLYVRRNSAEGDCAGLQLTAGVSDGRVASGANVTIEDNFCSGLSNFGKAVFEEGVNLIIVGNMNDKGENSRGGGVFNYSSNGAASLALPSGAVVYNNHAKTSGDDIYNGEHCTISFGKVGSEWALDGSGIGGNAHCADAIDGWYDDSDGARWEAHEAPVHADEFSDFDDDGLATVTGLKALKAAHGLVPLDPDDPNLPEWATSKSKTATNLDENFESEVTLSLPSYEEQLVSDIVLVVDKSTSSREESTTKGLEMLERLDSSLEGTDASINVGVVVFDGTSHVMRELSSYEYDSVKEALESEIPAEEDLSGTNMEAGILAAQKMLDADGEVAANRKHVIIVSDGLTRLFCDEEGNTQIIYNQIHADGTTWFGEYSAWCLLHGFSDGVYKVPGGSSWLDYYNLTLKGLVEADGDTYALPFYGNSTSSSEPEKYIPFEVNTEHATCVDRAFYDAYNAYLRLRESSYNCYSVLTGSSELGKSFMEALGGGSSTDFDSIYDDIYYLLDAGSKVVDVIGYGTYEDGTPYDFSFVDEADGLSITVGEETLEAEKIADELPEHAESGYGFGENDEGYRFELYYYEKGEDGTSDECFVWKMNEAISNFAPVKLTYSVRLDNPRSDESSFGQYDADGSEGYNGLLTNVVATLYPIDSNGEQGVPENFPRPTVSYEYVMIMPADITIYMGGDEGYESVVTGSGDSVVSEETDSLPEPGFYITLPDDVNDLIQEKLGITGAADLSNMITIKSKDGSRAWKLEKYGATASVAYDKFVYRIVPASENQDPVRLEFKSEDGNYYTSDNFDPMSAGALHSTYEMGIYPGNVDTNSIVMELTIGDQTVSRLVKLETGQLDVRFVTSESNPVTSVVNDVKVSEDAGEKAVAVVGDDAKYFINKSDIDVDTTPGADANPSLLFDDVVSDQTGEEAGEIDGTLLNKSIEALQVSDQGLAIEGHQSKYLDLVDSNNGNVWLTTDAPVTVYWPYPDGTDSTNEFRLVHFEGLDRDMSNDEVLNQIDNTDPTLIEVENTKYGVCFTLNPGEDGKVAFSPFVLMWGASSVTPTPQYGSLRVEKTITGDLASSEDMFTFAVTVKGANGKYGDVTFTDGEAMVSLKGGQSVIISGLSSGASYSVEEIDARGYELVSSSGTSGTIATGSTRVASFVNDKSTPEAPDPTDPIYPGAHKVLNGRDLVAGEFTFQLIAQGDAPMPAGSTGGTATTTNYSDGTVVFGGIVFDEAGTYSYVLREVSGSEEGMSYDASSHTLTVVVADENGDGKLEVTSLTYDGKAELPTFVNKYEGPDTPTGPDDPSSPGEPPNTPTQPSEPGGTVPNTGESAGVTLPAMLAVCCLALVLIGSALVIAFRRNG